MTFIILLFIFIIMNILDAVSTYYVVSMSGSNSEKNPVARFLIKKLGVIKGIMLLKFLVIPVVILMFYYKLHRPVLMNRVLFLTNLGYFIVVYNNYRVYKKIKKAKTWL